MARRIYYIVNARVPNRKAYGIQLAKMCEAFIESGVDFTLVIPQTKAPNVSVREFYDLRVDVPTVILAGLDWYDRGRIPFFLSSLVFMVSSRWYLLRECRRDPTLVVYTIDMDTFSFALLPFARVPVFSEIQDAKPMNFLNQYLFRHLRGVIAINTEVRDFLVRVFRVPTACIVAAQNGVEAQWLSRSIERDVARTHLRLPLDRKLAVYAGRFYDWKGLDVLPASCRQMPDVECYLVGGSVQEFQDASHTTDVPPNMHIIPACLNEEVPQWLAAADVLLVLGTKQNEGAYRYRSPMKTYEYMAMRRPVVASSAPALRAIVTEQDVLFYEPDDAKDLAAKVVEAAQGGARIEALVAHAYETASTHTWSNRAHTILAHIENVLRS